MSSTTFQHHCQFAEYEGRLVATVLQDIDTLKAEDDCFNDFDHTDNMSLYLDQYGSRFDGCEGQGRYEYYSRRTFNSQRLAVYTIWNHPEPSDCIMYLPW